jgi:Dolichyl-phosphate-mannose-protein mannosyltransferase.
MKNIYHRIINFIRPQPLTVVLFVYALFLVIYEWHNVISFNPFWGYDGGNHLDYILSLARDHRFPDLAKNPVAWHEPLYYLLQAAWAQPFLLLGATTKTLLKAFGVFQFGVSLATAFVLWKLIKILSGNKTVCLISFAALTSLPAFIQASTFVTNELLNYFFIVLVLYFFFRWFIFETPRRAHYLLLGLVMGLALLTKITAAIAVALVLIYLVLKSAQKAAGFKPRYILMSAAIALIMCSPWYAYRLSQGSGPSINNPAFLKPAPIRLDSRVKFFIGFDADIFKFPYWYSSGRAFWSMLYADSFYDYYGMMENRDRLATLPQSELIKTTINNTFVSKAHAAENIWLSWLGMFPLVLCLFGIYAMIGSFIKKRELAVEAIGLAVSAAFLFALIYMSYRYPYYDQGIVKSIFIWPFFIFPIFFGCKFIVEAWNRRRNAAIVLFALGLAAYLVLIRAAEWIVTYNY